MKFKLMYENQEVPIKTAASLANMDKYEVMVKAEKLNHGDLLKIGDYEYTIYIPELNQNMRKVFIVDGQILGASKATEYLGCYQRKLYNLSEDSKVFTINNKMVTVEEIPRRKLYKAANGLDVLHGLTIEEVCKITGLSKHRAYNISSRGIKSKKGWSISTDMEGKTWGI